MNINKGYLDCIPVCKWDRNLPFSSCTTLWQPNDIGVHMKGSYKGTEQKVQSLPQCGYRSKRRKIRVPTLNMVYKTNRKFRMGMHKCWGMKLPWVLCNKGPPFQLQLKTEVTRLTTMQLQTPENATLVTFTNPRVVTRLIMFPSIPTIKSFLTPTWHMASSLAGFPQSISGNFPRIGQ